MLNSETRKIILIKLYDLYKEQKNAPGMGGGNSLPAKGVFLEGEKVISKWCCYHPAAKRT
ncbi:hypothetical protein F1904_12735 [Akkermansia muciniphila]|nr:hypothetical protein F1904_12735 [Akkermansia muciniphila]